MRLTFGTRARGTRIKTRKENKVRAMKIYLLLIISSHTKGSLVNSNQAIFFISVFSCSFLKSHSVGFPFHGTHLCELLISSILRYKNLALSIFGLF